MTRVAAIDCGTNSLRLLVTELEGDEQRDLDRRTTIVRLGQGVDKTGEFAPEALERTFATLDDYTALINDLKPDRVRFVATSAARDARNGADFVAGVRARVGVVPDIIGGDEEAWLAYDGATRGLVALDDAKPPFLVVDIGGGSTEFVLGAGRSHDVHGQSLNIGSVRMTERHLTSDPPTLEQVEAAIAEIESAIDGLSVPLDSVGTLVGVAGTITTMAAMVLGLPTYDREAVHLARLDSGAVLTAVEEIVLMRVAERKTLGFMHPGRADVIGAGALVLGCVIRRVGLDSLVTSEQDILDGIAWSLV